MKIITNARRFSWQYGFLMALFLSGISKLNAQSQLVTGTIYHDSIPLSGVSIQIKDTNRSTVTNSKGQYSIGLLIGDILVFSLIGFQNEEVEFIDQKIIDISLEPEISKLDAVELTGGYYSLGERELTGNVTKVDRTQLDQQVIQSPMEALQGRVAGLEIETRTGLSGQAPTVTIRGRGSIRNFSDLPLYVIDGIPIINEGFNSLSQLYDSSTGIDPLSTLDPSLIESIEVLKDADATAIYGSRGANGVIIINTKRAKEEKIKFEIHAERGVSWVGKFINFLNTDQYLKMRKEAFKNDGIEPTTATAPDLLLWDQDRYTDWQKHLIGRNAEFQKYQGTISGGNAQTSFLLSGGFQKETTVIPGNFGFQNSNLYANINHLSSNKKLQLNTSINYGYRKSNLFNTGIFVQSGIRLPPNAPDLFGKEGNINWELDEYGNPTFDNPMAGMADPNIMRMQSIQWNGSISYKLLKGLSAKLNIGLNKIWVDDKHLVFKKNINPIYTTAFSTTTQRLTNREHFLAEPQLSYKVSFRNHTLNSIIGSTFQKNNSKDTHLKGQGYFSESQVGNIALAENKNVLKNELIEYRYAALFGRIGYSYANKYHVNLTGRRDGSSRFGKENRFGNFGAAGVAWEFYKEDFIYETFPWLSYGKIRGSYGTAGSDNIGDYQYRDAYSNITLQAGSLSQGGLIPSKLHNPYYHWEKNTKLEAAVELGLWKDRVFLSSSWYRERTGNQLIGLSLPSITGFNEIQGNFPATVQNIGWEFALNTTPIQTKTLDWITNLNITFPKNKLLDFPNIETSSYASQYKIGEPLSILKLYRFSEVDPETGKYVFEDVNGDGILNNKDQVVIADLSRKFYGGWYNNLKYKGWNLSFLFDFAKQNGRSYLIDYGSPGGQPGIRSNIPVEFLNSWHQSGDLAPHQKYTQNYDMGSYNYFRLSERGIEDASFIRLRSLSLSYSLNNDLLEALGMQHVQLYINAQNIYTLTSYKGQDPQNPGGFSIPSLNSLHIGLKLTL